MSLQEDRSHLEIARAKFEEAASELNALVGPNGVGGAAGGQTSSPLPKHVHYKIFRDYIEHEDALIDKRLLWNINIQGFLFATFGFSVQKLAEVQAKQGSELTGAKSLYVLIFVLPLFGASISYFAWEGVKAAQKAIENLANEWNDEAIKQHQGDNTRLPGITGGGVKPKHGSDDVHAQGFKPPQRFPIIFMVTWMVLFLAYSGFWLLYYFKPGTKW